MNDTPRTDSQLLTVKDCSYVAPHPTGEYVRADFARQLERQNAALKIERDRLRAVLQDIADASGFDNIGNWARKKAKNVLAKEAKP